MLLTITLTSASAHALAAPGSPAFSATALGYLLRKHPDRAQTFDLTFGKAHVFYPEATSERTTAALLLEVDPMLLARGRPGLGEGRGRRRPHWALEPYVNDRPYVASSFLSVALCEVFGSAMAGTPLAAGAPAHIGQLLRSGTPLALAATLSVVPCRGGAQVIERLFGPLGYEIQAVGHDLDRAHPEWGPSRYFTVTIAGQKTVAELLTHLYVLIPVLDGDKHYFIGDDEVAKLVRHGKGWLASHPEREWIAWRYLKHQRSLAKDALGALERIQADETTAGPYELDAGPDAGPGDAAPARPEVGPDGRHAGRAAVSVEALDEKMENGLVPGSSEKIPLAQQRIGAVLAVLAQAGARRVLDLGCGQGKLLSALVREKSFTEIVGVDVSSRCLEVAADRLRLDRMSERQRSRLRLVQSSLTYRDSRLEGYDAAAVIEVIEHLDLFRLPAFESSLFGSARPKTVIVTTPNAEYNGKLENLPPGKLRHADHRFEWSRPEFCHWAERIGAKYGFRVRFLAVGPEDCQVGAPTQMAVFSS